MDKDDERRITPQNNLDDMEQTLNALLADLQTNLNKVSPHPASTLHHSTTTQYQQYHPASTTIVESSQKSYPSVKSDDLNEESNTKTIQIQEQQQQHQQQQQQQQQHQHQQQEGQFYINADNHLSDTDQRVYQNEDFQIHQNGFQIRHSSPVAQVGSNETNQSSLGSSTQHHNYENSHPIRDKMYRHETREEVRTETRSSGPNPTPQRSTISNNLSELDSLLHDLNTTKHNSVIKESKVLNGTRPSVDSLLDELNSVGHHRAETIDKRSTLEEETTRTTHTPSSTYPLKATHVSASNATKELDDLMDSLSDFKINASSLQSQVDNAYAKPLPKRVSPPPPPKPQPKPKPAPPPNQLDSMLGSLTSHMTEQGINTSQKGCCCACDKPIVGQVITALGKTWHPEHFVCAHCKEELGTKNFFERDGKPYCEPDYHNLFSPKCAYCSGPILDKCVTAMNKTWHPEHFFCAQCGNTFGEEGFHEKNGKPYCKDDYFNMFAPKCGGCNNPIMENYISALNSQWHPECFVCRDCNQPFNGGSFFDHEGLPYCETHYHAKRGSLCAACNKPITGRCITAMFRKYHPEHFLCAFCLQQLNKGTFKEQNNKPYCHICFDKLYG